MANNYLEFSEILEIKTEEEEKWFRKHSEPIEDLEELIDEDGELDEELADKYYADLEYDDNLRDWGSFCVEMEGTFEDNNRRAWIHTEEYGDPYQVACLVKAFFKKFGREEWWVLPWAEYCSKPRVGEFGGGACVVTKDEIKWLNMGDWVVDTVKELEDEKNG